MTSLTWSMRPRGRQLQPMAQPETLWTGWMTSEVNSTRSKSLLGTPAWAVCWMMWTGQVSFWTNVLRRIRLVFFFFLQNNQLHYLVPAVKNLLNTIPSLSDKISEVENLTSQFPPVSNITENIKKIKELIEQARDAANRVRSRSLNTSTHAYPICPLCF